MLRLLRLNRVWIGAREINQHARRPCVWRRSSRAQGPTWTPVERKARWFNAIRLNAGLLAPRVWGGWGWFTRPAMGRAAGVPGRWGRAPPWLDATAARPAAGRGSAAWPE